MITKERIMEHNKGRTISKKELFDICTERSVYYTELEAIKVIPVIEDDTVTGFDVDILLDAMYPSEKAWEISDDLTGVMKSVNVLTVKYVGYTITNEEQYEEDDEFNWKKRKEKTNGTENNV